MAKSTKGCVTKLKVRILLHLLPSVNRRKKGTRHLIMLQQNQMPAVGILCDFFSRAFFSYNIKQIKVDLLGSSVKTSILSVKRFRIKLTTSHHHHPNCVYFTTSTIFLFSRSAENYVRILWIQRRKSYFIKAISSRPSVTSSYLWVPINVSHTAVFVVVHCLLVQAKNRTVSKQQNNTVFWIARFKIYLNYTFHS